MARFIFRCEGETFETTDVTCGTATAEANKTLKVDNRPAGFWREVAPNEFEWVPHRQ